MSLEADLLTWSKRARRDLPWRRTRDPWAILVSEVMLQQTQVSRVIAKFDAFMARFPDPAACAGAPPGDVIAAWSGLGYNRRALNLHRAAVEVEVRHGGRVPRDLEALMCLPGIGAYTARAVMAFAFEDGYGVVDTNAARVLARALAGRPLGRREVQSLADDVVPAGRAWAWNQAVLDLGAMVCVSRTPRCGDCPVAQRCRWREQGGPDPATRSRPQTNFAGSDRQGRGRLVEALREGRIPVESVAEATGWPEDRARARRVMGELVSEGLAVEVDGYLALP